MPSTDIYAYEYYPTPLAYVRWLREFLLDDDYAFSDGLGLAPCVGAGRIPGGFQDLDWITNDLDPAWEADCHGDAAEAEMWEVWMQMAHTRGRSRYDLIAENPAYSAAFPILWHAIHAEAAALIALHVRLSFFEATKSVPEKVAFLAAHQPKYLLHLPRYPYQKSRLTGDYSQDTVPSCWAIWTPANNYHAHGTKMIYPPAWVYSDAKAEHRARVREEKAARG